MSKALKKAAPISLFGDVLPSLPTRRAKTNISTLPEKPIADSRTLARPFTLTKELLDIKKYQDLQSNQHIAHEFQSFGCYLAETLADKQHTSLYIKLAKTLSRSLLERALSFVSDAQADNKAKLFMWKLQQLKQKASTP